MWLRLPKAFEVGVVGTTFERALDRAMGNKQAFEGHVKQFFETLLPIDEASIAGPLQGVVQALGNYDFFRQRHIVPVWEENLEMPLRSTHRASRLGQAIQEAIGVDARKIDFLARQQFGYFGQYATKLSDVGRKEKRTFGAAEVGLFTGTPATQSLDVRWVKKRAAERGALGTKEWKIFRETYLEPYYKAKTDRQREARAKTLRQAAKRLRRKWAQSPPRPEAEEKAAKKRAKELGQSAPSRSVTRTSTFPFPAPTK